MSTFIYTLQRKVQQLQQNINLLKEENSNLRQKVRFLFESSDLSADDDEPQTITQTYGGLGQAAYDTRTSQALGDTRGYRDNPMYSGYTITNMAKGVNNTIIPNGNIENFLRGYQAITLANGVVIYIPDFPPSNFSSRQVYQLVTANMLGNPGFVGSFGSGAEMIEAIRQAIYQAGEEGQLSAQQLNSIINRLNQPNINSYFNSAWNNIARYGSWNMNSPPPQF